MPLLRERLRDYIVAREHSKTKAISRTVQYDKKSKFKFNNNPNHYRLSIKQTEQEKGHSYVPVSSAHALVANAKPKTRIDERNQIKILIG